MLITKKNTAQLKAALSDPTTVDKVESAIAEAYMADQREIMKTPRVNSWRANVEEPPTDKSQNR